MCLCVYVCECSHLFSGNRDEDVTLNKKKCRQLSQRKKKRMKKNVFCMA